jgi:MFS family permease
LWLFVGLLLYAFFCAGAYLSVPFVKLIGNLGITQFVILLVGATAAMTVLFLIDWEKLSDRYKRVNRDLWFMFVKGAILGLAAGICLVWITLFKLEILPFRYIWIFFVMLFVFVWLMDRKAKVQKHKRFPDVEDLLKRKH